MTTAAAEDRALQGAATPSLFPLRGHGVSAPAIDKPFKPYVYGAARSRAALRALAQAEAEHGPRPQTLRGIEGQDSEPAARLRRYRRPTVQAEAARQAV